MFKGWDLIGNSIRIPGPPNLCFNGEDNGPVEVRLGATPNSAGNKLPPLSASVGNWPMDAIDGMNADFLSFYLAKVNHGIVRKKGGNHLIEMSQCRY